MNWYNHWNVIEWRVNDDNTIKKNTIRFGIPFLYHPMNAIPFELISFHSQLFNHITVSRINTNHSTNTPIMHTSPSQLRYNRYTFALLPLSTFLSFTTTFQIIPFNSFQAFHLAFSYLLQSVILSYSEVEHTRCRNIAITNCSLLEQRVSS